MKKHNYNQRTMKVLNDEGYIPAVVEHYNFYSGVTNDLFGMIDIVAIHPNKVGVLGVQMTRYDSGVFAAHRRKIYENPIHKIWLSGGNRLELWGYSPVVHGKSIRFELVREVIIAEGDLGLHKRPLVV